MIRYIVGAVALFILTALGLSWYLQPNDLARCNYQPSSQAGCQSVDAIVAISGGDTQARANYAIDLYKKGWSHTIIFSGAAQDKSGPSNAAVMKTLAIDAGIPKDNILIDEYSETTLQNAQNTKTLFTSHNIKNVILVTSGYHQRRAFLEFNKRNFDVVILNSPVLADRDWSPWWWTTVRGWWLAVNESVKITFFHISDIWI